MKIQLYNMLYIFKTSLLSRWVARRARRHRSLLSSPPLSWFPAVALVHRDDSELPFGIVICFGTKGEAAAQWYDLRP